MDNYIYKFEFPESGKVINFREFTTKEQINLCKSRLSFIEPLDYLRFIFELFSNCVENKEDFKNLTLLDFTLFVIKMRILSVGVEIKLNVENSDGEKFTITVDLNEVLKNIANLKFTETVEIDEFKFHFGFPKIDKMDLIFKKEPNFLDLGKFFIKKMNEYDVDFTSPEMSKQYDKISAKMVKKINDICLKFLKDIFSENVFKIEFLKDLGLNVFNGSYVELLKFINFYDLKSIQEEIFALSKLNPLYIMNISPIERMIYINILLEKNKKNDNSLEDIDFMEESINNLNYG